MDSRAGFSRSKKDPSHALRHWFKSKCLALGVQDSVVDAIQGHTLKGGAAATYRHISIAMMGDAINRIPVPGEIANRPTERRKAD
jgi:integrase